MASKVRIACQRCRAKRIKCDGGIPACSHCQSAGQPCLDVDGRNNAISIPRNFVINARARITWLEDQLRQHAPHVNLDAGPKVDPPLQESANGQAMLEEAPPQSKRSFSAIQDQQQSQEQLFTTEARSVAIDLGMLSLGSDSRELHYLGTSSGRLFTSLIGLDSPQDAKAAQSRGDNHTPISISQPSPIGKPSPVALAKRHRDTNRLVCDMLRKTLPAREEAYVLLETYLRTTHVEHPFLHPGSVVHAIEALYQCVAADSSSEIGFNGWVTTVVPFGYNGEFAISRGVECTSISMIMAAFHVLMVFALAATVRTRQRIYDFAPDKFYRAATSIAKHCFSITSVASLQAILLAAVYSLISPSEMNIWTLTYTAIAQCIDLGLHRMPKDGNGVSSAAALTRKLVFFTVYHLDRSVATIQGRPLGIRDETFDVQLPSLQDVQADIAELPTSPLGQEISIPTLIAFAIHRFKLDPIISEIKLLFYHLPTEISPYSWPTDSNTTQKAILTRLEEWRRESAYLSSTVPQELMNEDIQSQIRCYEMKVHNQFYAAMILLHQPSQMVPQPSEDALLICYRCAASRINTYNSLYNAGSLFQSWRSVQGVFSAGATMIYCLWTSTSVQRSIPLSNAMTDLRTCTNLLSIGGEWWPSVKRGKETFGRAMDALQKKLHQSATTQRIQRRTSEINQSFSRTMSRRPDGEDTFGQAELPGDEIYAGDGRVSNDVRDVNATLPLNLERPAHIDSGIIYEWPMPEAFVDGRLPFGTNSFDDSVDFATNTESTDYTIEAFITEFLQDDTTWNPF